MIQCIVTSYRAGYGLFSSYRGQGHHLAPLNTWHVRCQSMLYSLAKHIIIQHLPHYLEHNRSQHLPFLHCIVWFDVGVFLFILAIRGLKCYGLMMLYLAFFLQTTFISKVSLPEGIFYLFPTTLCTIHCELIEFVWFHVHNWNLKPIMLGLDHVTSDRSHNGSEWEQN